MRIGLMRHYKVIDDTSDHWMSSKGFSDWVVKYNNADIDLQETKTTDSEWDHCYTSDMIRAVKTAETVYKGELVSTDLLREIEIMPMFHSNFKLHLNMWLFMGRIGWLIKHHTQENKISTLMRARKVIDVIEEGGETNSNVLIVSHGALMTVLRHELLLRGYTGERFVKPKNGQIYTYHKEF